MKIIVVATVRIMYVKLPVMLRLADGPNKCLIKKLEVKITKVVNSVTNAGIKADE